MNRTHRLVALGIVVALTGLGAAACGSSSTASGVSASCKPAHKVTTVKKGVLTVAAVEIPPASSTVGGDFTGVEGILLKKFAAENCLALKPEKVSFAGAIPAVQSGRADIASGGFYRTAERAKVVGLSDPLYIDKLAAVSKDGVSSVGEMKGKKIGTVDGYLWVPDAKKEFGSDLSVYPSDVEMKADLAAGRIAVGLDSLGAAQALFAKSGMRVLPVAADDSITATKEPAQIGLPFTHGNTSLDAALKAAISTWHSNGTIADALKTSGMPEGLADVGEPRLIE